jgi:hypothetical protein
VGEYFAERLDDMRTARRSIYVSTLVWLLNAFPKGEFTELRRFLKTYGGVKVSYTEGDEKDLIWELLLSSERCRDFRLINEYADYMRTLEPFSWFCTLTFSEPVAAEQADRCLARWIRKLSERIVGRRYRRKKVPGISWIRALEWQKRGVLHIHALLEHPGLSKVPLKAACDLWKGVCMKSGTSNRIEKYDPTRGACGYIGKDIFNDGDINFSEPITWMRRVDGIAKIVSKAGK